MLLHIFLLAAFSSVEGITLDLATVAHRYDGHGGLSAGASSRLLWDYPPDIAADILDMLFLPKWGLGLHTLKVEIGGDTQSTDGTEPSHMHARDDLSCGRGYELWLLREAKLRNPDIVTFGLSWGAPYWTGNGSYFTPDMWVYQTQWVKCIEQELGFTVDYLGVWNERYWGGQDYVIGLRASLDSAGFTHTKIVIPDGGYDAAIMQGAASNATFNASFDVVGLHYPCDDAHPEVQQGGKAFWSSEHWWSQPDWPGAGCWGHLLNQNYVRMNHTATIAWSPLWSVYDQGLPDEGAGLIFAPQPWTGWWQVSPPVWTGAQWSQFTAPGWRFLSVPGGGSGFLPGNGTYVTLVPPEGAPGMTLIIETLLGPCRCQQDPIGGTQNVTFYTAGGLPGPGSTLFVWQTTQDAQFVQLTDIQIGADSSFTVAVPRDAMITVTTVAGGRKGAPRSPIPPAGPFPFPYSDDFTSYGYDAMAKYFADQYGSFAIRNGSLTQVDFHNSLGNSWVADADPISLIGDVTWTDVRVSVNASIGSQSGIMQIEEMDRDGHAAFLLPCDPTSPYQSWVWDNPATGYLSNTPPPNGEQQCLNVYGCDDAVVYWSCVTEGGTCCGPTCYKNLQWRLDGAGRLVTALDAATCVTSYPVGQSLTMEACGPAGQGNQTWTYSAASGSLELGSTGLCLAQPTPTPPRSYSQVCARIANLAVFSAPSPPTGYCLSLDTQGTWNITTGAGSIAGGTSHASISGSWHALALTIVGTNVTASIDGTVLASLQDSTYANGMAAVGSGYHPAQFQAFAVAPAGASSDKAS